ncbi:helix-turn-helix domain-containing protein [Saccharopolyspora thermophila]
MGQGSRFGVELRRLRRQAGLSLSELAERVYYTRDS